MKIKTVNPTDNIYAASLDYVHGLQVSAFEHLIFVSGTMGLTESGSVPNSLEGQLELVWHNLRRILHEADMTTANIVRLTSYLADAAYAQANQDARLVALGDHRVPTTAVVTRLLDDRWKVEIEIIAAR